MATATVTSKGQVTIPADVRNALDLRAGTQIEFAVEADHLVAHKVVVIRESDLWMMHADVVAEMESSLRDVAEGRTSGPESRDEFLARLASL